MSDHGCLIFQVDIRQKPDELIQSVKRTFCIYSIFRTRAVLNELIRGIAQLGERLPCKQEVAGSIPAVSTSRINSCPGGE